MLASFSPRSLLPSERQNGQSQLVCPETHAGVQWHLYISGGLFAKVLEKQARRKENPHQSRTNGKKGCPNRKLKANLLEKKEQKAFDQPVMIRCFKNCEFGLISLEKWFSSSPIKEFKDVGGRKTQPMNDELQFTQRNLEKQVQRIWTTQKQEVSS